MKLKILLLLFAAFTFQYSFSQPYQSIFGEEETIWHILEETENFAESRWYKTYGDTIINEKNYTKVGHGLIGLIYISEDSEIGKLWYYEHRNNSEYLIMDLDLSVGDTLYFDNYFTCKDIYWTDCDYVGYAIVDSVYYENERKIISFDLCIYLPIATYMGDVQFCEIKFMFIEGLGPNASILYQRDTEFEVLNTLLLCTTKDEELVYKDSVIDSCDYLKGLTNVNHLKNSIRIYPNPTTNLINVIFEGHNKTQIKIYNLFGKEVYNTEFIKQVTINIASFPKGVYFIEISDDSNKHIEKLIKF
jgi:hypothetical protein